MFLPSGSAESCKTRQDKTSRRTNRAEDRLHISGAQRGKQARGTLHSSLNFGQPFINPCIVYIAEMELGVHRGTDLPGSARRPPVNSRSLGFRPWRCCMMNITARAAQQHVSVIHRSRMFNRRPDGRQARGLLLLLLTRCLIVRVHALRQGPLSSEPSFRCIPRS